MSGIAGYKAQLKLGGTPTIFTDEPLTRLGSYTYRISNEVKRVLSANHSITIKDSLNQEVVGIISEINYLEGVICFSEDPESAYSSEFTISGRYIPLAFIGGSKEYSLEIGGDILEDSAFHDGSGTSDGYKTRVYGIHDIKATFGRWNDFINTLDHNVGNSFNLAKENKTPIFVSINPGGSKTLIKGWFHIETDNLSGDVGSLEDQSLSLVLCDNNGKTSFSYSYNWTDEECEDIAEEDLLLNWFNIDT